MNILLFHTVDFPNGGAGSAHAALIVRGLRKNKKKAYLMIPYGGIIGVNTGNERIKGHYGGVPYFYMNKKTTRSSNVIKSFFEIYSGMINSAFFLFKRKLMKKKDVIIIGNPDVSRYFPIIFCCILLRIPFYIWAVERNTSDTWMTKYKSGIIKYLGFKIAETILPRFSSGVMVISTRLRNLYYKYLSKNKIIIYPILVDKEITYDKRLLNKLNGFKKKYKDKKVIVYSGDFSEKDGIHYILDAFSIVSRRYPNVHLIMTGYSSNPKTTKSVQDHINHLNLGKNTELVGFVRREDLTCYNLMAQILLVCRTNSEFANYGFPWKLGEYCMTGRPILATNVSDIGLYFKNGKDIFLVEPENSKAIAEKMIYILKNYDKALSVAENTRVAAEENFDYVKQTKRIIEFIKKNL